MRHRYFAIALILLAASSCSEVIDVHVRNMDKTYLVVEALLTDQDNVRQIVTLTESISYFSKDTVPCIKGASVILDDGSSSIVYAETDEPGVYQAPAGFHGTAGKTYHLHIDAVVAGKPGSYDAESTMPEHGCQIDSVDYVFSGNPLYKIDSLWTISIWGKDKEQTSYYYMTAAVNGNYFPYDLSSVMDDRYFAGQEITGFPMTMIHQTERNRKRFGDCCKYLETGDVLTVSIYTLPKYCFEFFSAYASNTAGNMPMFSSQPANVPTNITGGDAMGIFAACSVSSADRVVDDPLRPVFNYLIPKAGE